MPTYYDADGHEMSTADTTQVYASTILAPGAHNLSIGNGSPPASIYGIGNNDPNLMIATPSSSGAAMQLGGGLGNDVLVDNAGAGSAVTFILGKDASRDVVYGFKASGAAHDVARLQGWGLTSFDAVKAHMQELTDSEGLKTVLTADDGVTQVIFRGLHIADFTAQDFQIDLDLAHLVTHAVTFHDEFDGPTLDFRNPYLASDDPAAQGKWRLDIGNQGQDGLGSYQLPSNGEQQVYVSPYYRNPHYDLGLTPFSFDNGRMVITAQAVPSGAQQAGAFHFDTEIGPVDVPYMSGFISTAPNQDGGQGFAQQYGYFEMRASLPDAPGTWPAFWLLPVGGNGTTHPPELDVMERFADKNAYGATVHDGTAGGVAALSNVFTGPLTGTHTYGVLWTPDKLVWTFDGTEVFETTTPDSMKGDTAPFYLLANLAMGGLGGPVTGAGLPATMSIDYIRVWGLNPNTAGDGYQDHGGGGSTGGGSGGVAKTGDGVDHNIVGTAGDDTLTSSQAGGDTLTGQAGADHFAWGATLSWNPDAIADFHRAEGDKIDFSALLAHYGYTGTDPVADQWIKLLNDNNGGTWVYFDTDGTGSGDQWGTYVTDVQGVSGLTLADFITGAAGSGGGGSGGVSKTGDGVDHNITGTAGNDTLISSQAGGDTLTGQAGADHFGWGSTLSWNPDVIADFHRAEGDKIDLSALLAHYGYAGADPIADHWVKVLDDGQSGTWIYFDTDGAGTGDQWGTYIGDVQGVSGLQGSDFIFA